MCALDQRDQHPIVTVRRLRRREGEQLRELRLRALAEAPYAFATTFEAARARPAEHWEEFALKSEAAASQVTFVVFEDDPWLGMASAFLNPDEPGEAHMVQMWWIRRRAGRDLDGCSSKPSPSGRASEA